MSPVEPVAPVAPLSPVEPVAPRTPLVPVLVPVSELFFEERLGLGVLETTSETSLGVSIVLDVFLM